MSILLAAAILSQVAFTSYARREDVAVFASSNLAAPCREEAEAYYVGQGRTVYQWSASHKSRGNVLYVEGRLRLDQGDVQVTCRLPQGARLAYMDLEVDEP